MEKRTEFREKQEHYEEIRLRASQIDPEFKGTGFDPLFIASKVIHSVKEDQVSIKRDQFEEVADRLAKDLNFLLEDNFDACFDSLEYFSRIAELMQGGRDNIAALEGVVGHAKDALLISGKELKSLFESNEQYKMMVDILSKIGEIYQIPQKVKGLVARKHFIRAVKMVNHAVKVAEENDLWKVKAMRDVASEIFALRSRFPHLLVEELQNHMYLRAPYAKAALEAAQKEKDPDKDEGGVFDGSSLPVVPMVSSPLPGDGKAGPKSGGASNGTRKEAEEEEEEMSKNPESDTFAYMRFLVTAIFYLDRPEETLNLISKSAGKEVERVSRDILSDILDEAAVQSLSREAKSRQASSETSIAPQLNAKMIDRLRNVLLTHFDRIFSNHLFVNQFFEQKCKEKDMQSAAGRDEARIRVTWAAMQNDLRHILELLFSYSGLADTDEDGTGDQPAQPLFSFNLSDALHHLTQSDSGLQKEEVKMERGKESSKEPGKSPVEGGVAMVGAVGAVFAKGLLGGLQKSLQEVSIPTSPPPSQPEAVEPMTPEAPVDGPLEDRVILLNPNPYNVTLLYTPVTHFEDSMVKKIGCAHRRELFELRRYLDDFVRSVFFVRLDRDAEFLASRAMEGYSAFKPSESRSLSQSIDVDSSVMTSRGPPIVTSAQALADLIDVLLDHSKSLGRFSTELVGVMERILGKYYNLASEKVQRTIEGKFICRYIDAKSVYEKDPAWKDLVGAASTVGSPYAAHPSVAYHHIAEELQADEQPLFDSPSLLHTQNLLMQSSQLGFLASMHESLRWLANHIRALVEQLEKRGRIQMDAIEGLRVLRERFEGLGLDCLLLLKMELRYHCHFFLGSMAKSNYALEEEMADPEPFILELNKDFSNAEVMLSRLLRDGAFQYAFSGITVLLGTLLIRNVSKIKKVTRFGVRRLQRNMSAVQQNITSIMILNEVQKRQFERVREYYSFLRMEKHQDLLRSIVERPSFEYTKDEYVTALRLINSHVSDSVLSKLNELLPS